MKIEDKRINVYKPVGKLKPGDVFNWKEKTYIKTTEYDAKTFGSICVDLQSGETKKFNLSENVFPLNTKVVIE